jgi:hypothetical protein
MAKKKKSAEERERERIMRLQQRQINTRDPGSRFKHVDLSKAPSRNRKKLPLGQRIKKAIIRQRWTIFGFIVGVFILGFTISVSTEPIAWLFAFIMMLFVTLAGWIIGRNIEKNRSSIGYWER